MFDNQFDIEAYAAAEIAKQKAELKKQVIAHTFTNGLYVTYEEILSTLERLLPDMEIDLSNEDYAVMPTLCHNIDVGDAKHKLYLYKNDGEKPMFHCYTECSESFDIHELLIRRMALQGDTIGFKDTLDIIYADKAKKPITLTFENKKTNVEDYTKTFINPTDILLPEVKKKNILNLFDNSNLNPWLYERISAETLRKWHIGYSTNLNVVSVPHYDHLGRLVGIRGRFYEEKDVQFGKYRPLYDGSTILSHPLAYNLYGIHLNAENIKQAKTLVLFEGEKSCLKYEELFKEEPNISLAVCGSAISKWQQEMIVHYLSPSIVIIAFDKEYENYNEWYEYKVSIANKVSYLKGFAEVYILYDKENRFKLKDSPVDRTLTDFQRMELVQL